MTDEFSQYFASRPRWLQIAATRFIESKSFPTTDEYEELADICLAEVDGETVPDADEVTTALLATSDTGPSLRIRRIEDPVGIDALSDTSYIDAKDADLLIVYGPTGSGKSSHARLLKEACGIRTERPVMGNVYAPNEKQKSARITYAVGDDEKTINWQVADGPIDDLRRVSVFDTEIADRYFSLPIESCREPFSLRFLSVLIEVSDRLRRVLEKRKTELVKKLPNLPSSHQNTATSKFLGTLRPSTTVADAETHCDWSQEDLAKKNALEKVLSDQNPGQTLIQRRKDEKAIVRLKEFWNRLLNGYSKEKLSEIVILQRAAFSARTAADTYAKEVFSGASVEHIGSTSWKLLWEAARKFSETEAYPDQDFPYTGGDCVLCNQPLSDDVVRVRMARFDSFVKGELESAASSAETEYQKKLDELPTVPSKEDWEDRFVGLDIPAGQLDKAREEFESKRTIAPKLTKQEQITEVSAPEVANAIEDQIHALTVEIETLEKAADDDKTSILEAELSELKAREWLSAQKAEVLAEIERLKKVRRLDEAIKKVDTSSLTKFKNRLATTDLIGAFQTRFGSELGVLGGGSIKVLPAGSGVGKGKVVFDIQLQSASEKSRTSEVLSEGEQRVVGLATFLADVSQQGNDTPFVFDDPITSLDQDYEENVVKRLVELAKQRQVIVFTHRLSLKALISDVVKKQKQIATQTGEEPSPTMEVAIVRSVGGKVGVVTDSLISEKNVVSALNAVLQRANTLQKIDAANDFESFVNDMTAVCSDFRILIERTVEEELLNNIVGRFRRSIITQGKLPKLSMINVQDAELLDNLMTRYSVFEHSQSMELPTDPPEADEVAKDIEVLRDWIKEFRSRGKAP